VRRHGWGTPVRSAAHPELCDVEGHHHVVGVELNDAETLVVEGTRPAPG
jgi:hypothetical protein